MAIEFSSDSGSDIDWCFTPREERKDASDSAAESLVLEYYVPLNIGVQNQDKSKPTYIKRCDAWVVLKDG